MPRQPPAGPGAVRFVDFAIRAWRTDPQHVEVIAHSTPVGGMRQPVSVRQARIRPADMEMGFSHSLERAAEIGRDLARVLLPDAVHRLLLESLRWAADRPDIGLRLRLCLDDELIDLPWECLYRPELTGPALPAGFFLADGDLSLVREPPIVLLPAGTSERAQRLLFAGTLFDGEMNDAWLVRDEFATLRERTAALASRVAFDFVATTDAAEMDARLATPIDIFHYAGHVEADNDDAHFLQCAHFDDRSGFTEAAPAPAPWTRARVLAPRLKAAGTRLAVFNACNSGHWNFARPFMQSALPTFIGVQGSVSNDAALAFSAELYGALAAGLSVDEAVTQARLAVLDVALRDPSDMPAAQRTVQVSANDWLRFMIYMPTGDAVLFPRPERGGEKRQARQRRADRLETLYATLARLNDSEQARIVSELYRSRVLILGRFDAAHKPTLEALGRALEAHPNHYRKHLFDYAPPAGRNLTEWVRTHALMSRFIVADISDPSSVPHELASVVPTSPSVPIVPIIREGAKDYSMFRDLRAYPWVLPTVTYRDDDDLRARLDADIVAPAEARVAAWQPA